MSKWTDDGHGISKYKRLFAIIPFAEGNVCCHECMCYSRQSMTCRLSGNVNTRPQAGTTPFCPLMELEELINLENAFRAQEECTNDK